MARIDHVLYGVQDLGLAAERIATEHGLVAVGGGSHGELGTANVLVPLGEQYLELIAVADPASEHPLAVVLGQWLAARGDHLVAMAVEVPDADAAADRLGSTVLAGARTADDGSRVEFRLAGFEIGRAHV